MEHNDALEQFWEARPRTIREFLEKGQLYEKLAEEVAYILKKSVASAGVEYSSITHRAKTLRSFCEKAVRKSHDKPLDDVTDLAGVRIVFLYLSDQAVIETAIKKQFAVIERVDKIAESEPNEFGYGAVHYIVSLRQKTKGPRYDDLRGLLCEIQVRTILQDAWAIVAHHLSYKQESDVPAVLRRKLNALSGLFETADDQFNQLNADRKNYRDEIADKIEENTSAILRHGINLDNLIAYADWKLPDRKSLSSELGAELLEELSNANYRRISQIDNAINQSLDTIKELEKEMPPIDKVTQERTVYVQGGLIRLALSLVDEQYLAARQIPDDMKDHYRQYRSRLKGKIKTEQ